MLVYARREETERHKAALTALTELAEGSTPWGLPTPCITEFIRVVTHPAIFRPPTSLQGAFAFLDALLESPTVRLLLPGARFVEHLRRATLAADARGNLALVAQIAALCAEHGARDLLTADRDFARFPDLRPTWL